MSRTLTASDRSVLIRLASTLPVGSTERKAILAGLSRQAQSVQFGNAKLLDERGKPIYKGGLARDGSDGDEFIVQAVIPGKYNGQGFVLRLTYKIVGSHSYYDGWSFKVMLTDFKNENIVVLKGPLSKDQMFDFLTSGPTARHGDDAWDEVLEIVRDLIDTHYNTDPLNQSLSMVDFDY